jgi:two-component system sensor histidine kinase QseC
VTIRVEGECGGRIACNQGLATTALRNVLENALLHSPAGGEVVLSVTDDDTKLRLVVEDRGPGMSEAEFAHAGERFFRGRGQAPSGTGLGLAIVETVLKRAGGSATFTNRDGGGLRVELHFPLA